VRIGLKILIPCIITALTAGCATYQPKPLDPGQTAAAFESRSLTDSGLKDFLQRNLKREVLSWPRRSWDLTMLTLAAFYYHPDLDSARANVAVADAEAVTAGGRPNPTAGFTPQYDVNSAGISPWTLGFNLDIPIETAGKRGYRLAQAKALSDASRFKLASVAWQVRSRVRKNLIELYAGRERETMLTKQFDVQEHFTNMLEQRFSRGMIALPLVTDARIARDDTRLTLDDAKRRTAEAIAALADSLGLPGRALEGVHYSFDFIKSLPGGLPFDEMRRLALLNRTEIRSSLAEYAASESALRLELAKQYPDIHIGPGYTWDQGQNKWSIGFSMTLPLFNRNEGPIAEAEARRQQAAARFTALQARIIGELDRTLAGYRASLKTAETAADILEAERMRRETLRKRLKPGEASGFALTNADVSLITAELSRLDALVKAQQALGLLEDALQRPVEQTENVPLEQETDPRQGQGREP
jgi:cobalt-zinc-cadmium efflux system outer membrane protein